MCLTCGCGDAHKTMGANVTYEDLRDVSVENGKTVDETLRVLAERATRDRIQHVEEYALVWDTGHDG